MKFANTMTNVGGGWDKSKSVFTAPGAGNYNFFWTVFSHGVLSVLLMKSDEPRMSQCAIWPDADIKSKEDLEDVSTDNLKSCSQ